VEIQATNAPCWVAGDGAQLQIAVANLLRNAREALLSAATVAPRIDVTLRRDGGALELEVADNGPGLPPDLRDANPVASSEAKGMGVGLYVVQTTMENHGGTLRLGRSPLGGAAVVLRLPALPTPPSGPSPL
jgi:signal transduction histidine kinase